MRKDVMKIGLVKQILAVTGIGVFTPLVISASAMAFSFTGSYPANGSSNLPVNLSAGANGPYVIRLEQDAGLSCQPDTLSATLTGDGNTYYVYTIGSGDDATGDFISVNWASDFMYRPGYSANTPLQPYTTYTFQVNSATLQCNNGVQSLDSPYTIQFSTGADTIAPSFFPNGPTATSTDTTITYTWSTDKLTTGSVSVNNNSYPSSTSSNTHSVTVTGLQPDTTYNATITITDASGNTNSATLNTKTQASITPILGTGSGTQGNSSKPPNNSGGSQPSKTGNSSSNGNGGTNGVQGNKQGNTSISNSSKSGTIPTTAKVAGGVGAAGVVGVGAASWLGYIPYKRIGLIIGKMFLK